MQHLHLEDAQPLLAERELLLHVHLPHLQVLPQGIEVGIEEVEDGGRRVRFHLWGQGDNAHKELACIGFRWSALRHWWCDSD